VLSRVAVRDGVSVADTFVDGGIAIPEASLNVDGHAADAESRGWIEALSSTGAEREDAVARLHRLLVRASRFEVARRRRALGGRPAGDLEDLAMQAADDALVAILRKLHTFRGDSRFTTSGYKFALLEAGVKIRRRAWHGREVPLEEDGSLQLPVRRA
jgi:RNA polymerase sigma-70 factor, ECF subfamily